MRKLFTVILSLILLTTSNLAYSRMERGRGGHGPERGRGGSHRGPERGRPGYIGHPTHIVFGRAPYGGWRGNRYYWGGHNYFVWAWGPWAPYYGWNYYYGWRIGLNYYVPEGLRCYADNPRVSGEWAGQDTYYASDDAINSALDYCANDPNVTAVNASNDCRIRNCVRW